MKTTLAALAATLAVAAPCPAQTLSSQTPGAAFAEELQKMMAETLTARKKQAESRANAPKADPKAIKILVDRLGRDGEPGAAEGGWGARSYTLNGEPDKKGYFENYSVVLIERDLPPPMNAQGTIAYAVLRKELSHIQGTMQAFTKLANGRATLEQWEFRVELDGTITVVQKTTIVGAQKTKDTIEVDPAEPGSHRQQQLAPTAPGVLQQWRKMEKKFLTMGRLYEA